MYPRTIYSIRICVLEQLITCMHIAGHCASGFCNDSNCTFAVFLALVLQWIPGDEALPPVETQIQLCMATPAVPGADYEGFSFFPSRARPQYEVYLLITMPSSIGRLKLLRGVPPSTKLRYQLSPHFGLGSVLPFPVPVCMA